MSSALDQIILKAIRTELTLRVALEESRKEGASLKILNQLQRRMDAAHRRASAALSLRSMGETRVKEMSDCAEEFHELANRLSDDALANSFRRKAKSLERKCRLWFDHRQGSKSGGVE